MSKPTALEQKRNEQVAAAAKKKAEADKLQAELDELIPVPVGWSILIALADVEETFDGSIVKSAETVKYETILSSVGLVLQIGAQAYKDKDRFSEGPWCKVGDYVMFRPNSGTRFKMGRREYRLLNDDSIEAIVPNPKVISSAR